MFFFDTETCGFHGPLVTIQYAYDDAPPTIHEAWCEPAIDTIMLIEQAALYEEGVCGFNLAFDWFHMCRFYCMLQMLTREVGTDAIPREHINLMAKLEAPSRDESCLKPVTALDLMLHARKGPYQNTMDRKKVVIRRIPKRLSFLVAAELEKRIPLPNILFARFKDINRRWQVRPARNYETGGVDPEFNDIVLAFAPSSALKALCYDAGIGKKDSRLLFSDVMPLNKPLEIGWAPFATAISCEKDDWWCKIGKKVGRTWPGLIEEHIVHWRFDNLAREYAADDVTDLRGLFEHFGRPKAGDVDSVLACMVGASRWRGLAVDIEGLTKLAKEEGDKAKGVPVAPQKSFIWLKEVMTEAELESSKLALSTGKNTLEIISHYQKDCSCKKVTTTFEGPIEALEPVTTTVINPNCTICKGFGLVDHPAAARAKVVLAARMANYKKGIFTKLVQAGRLHPSATVIGSLSGRMSGRTEVGDGQKSASINALGIQHDKKIRACFPLAFPGNVLNGGDAEAFEVSIAEAAYDDPDLRAQLLMCVECEYVHTPDEYRTVTSCPKCGCGYTACKTCKGQVVVKGGLIHKPCSCGNCIPYPGHEGTFKKIHALFAEELFPEATYDDIIRSKGTENDMYDKGKRSIFGGLLYGGDENTMFKRVGIPIEIGQVARPKFFNRFKGIGREQKRCFESFCSMRQEKAHGKVTWHDPADSVSSLNGFERWFTLENQITKALFNIGNDPPKVWLEHDEMVYRRDRWQKAGNAIRSAMFAAAFGTQSAVMRAALNHRIQSTGAIEIKNLQAEIWELQPPGANEWIVQPFNVHDELMVPCKDEVTEKVAGIVNDFVERTKKLIPLLKIDWKSRMKNWAEK